MTFADPRFPMSRESDRTEQSGPVLVVTVTFNSAALIPSFVAALPAALEGIDEWRLVVADNASTDSTLVLLGELCPDATIVRRAVNSGYAAGINAALAAGDRWDTVLVLNPDARLSPGSARLLLDAIRTDGAGITVPRLVDEQGGLCRSLRREPTLARALGEALLGGGLAGRFERLGEVVVDPRRYETDGTFDWATGAAWLVSRECMEAVGPWDESFFLYSEESDFALRARAAGFALRFVAEANGVHRGGDLQESPRLWTLQAVNRVRLFGRLHGRLHTAAFWAAVVANEGIRSLTGRATSRAALRGLVVPWRWHTLVSPPRSS